MGRVQRPSEPQTRMMRYVFRKRKDMQCSQVDIVKTRLAIRNIGVPRPIWSSYIYNINHPSITTKSVELGYPVPVEPKKSVTNRDPSFSPQWSVGGIGKGFSSL